MSPSRGIVICGYWEGFHRNFRCLFLGIGRWLSVRQPNSSEPLIGIVPIQCIQTNQHKLTTREMKRVSALCDARSNTAATNSISPSATALCYEASLPVAHVRACWLTVRWSIGEHWMVTEALSPSHSLASRVLILWVGVVVDKDDLHLSCCCKDLPRLCLLLRETSLSKLGG